MGPRVGISGTPLRDLIDNWEPGTLLSSSNYSASKGGFPGRIVLRYTCITL